jgi:hypothetical protein
VELAGFVERATRRIKTTLERELLRTRTLSSAVELDEAHDLRPLTDQWSLPIAGLTASTSLLTRIVTFDYTRDELDDTVAGTSSGVSSESSLAPTNGAGQLTAATAETTHSLTSAAVPAIASSSVTSSVSSLHLHEHENVILPVTAPAIAPPSVAPSLPPLHSHKTDDVVVPIAAATAQRQARIEQDITREDNLPLLAERIERILKEEARRHGIDV